MDLSAFEKLGMKVAYKANSCGAKECGQVNLKYNNDTKAVYVSMDIAIAELAFSTIVGLKILPILDVKRGRLYFAEHENGYCFKVNATQRKGKNSISGNRMCLYSKPLFDQMTRAGYRRVVNGDVLFDDKLKAYYVEVQ